MGRRISVGGGWLVSEWMRLFCNRVEILTINFNDVSRVSVRHVLVPDCLALFATRGGGAPSFVVIVLIMGVQGMGCSSNNYASPSPRCDVKVSGSGVALLNPNPSKLGCCCCCCIPVSVMGWWVLYCMSEHILCRGLMAGS